MLISELQGNTVHTNVVTRASCTPFLGALPVLTSDIVLGAKTIINVMVSQFVWSIIGIQFKNRNHTNAYNTCGNS